MSMWMQIVFNKCAAKYEFEALWIPHAGYETQCKNCKNVFFVKPLKDLDPLVSDGSDSAVG